MANRKLSAITKKHLRCIHILLIYSAIHRGIWYTFYLYARITRRLLGTAIHGIRHRASSHVPLFCKASQQKPKITAQPFISNPPNISLPAPSPLPHQIHINFFAHINTSLPPIFHTQRCGRMILDWIMCAKSIRFLVPRKINIIMLSLFIRRKSRHPPKRRQAHKNMSHLIGFASCCDTHNKFRHTAQH